MSKTSSAPLTRPHYIPRRSPWPYPMTIQTVGRAAHPSSARVSPGHSERCVRSVCAAGRSSLATRSRSPSMSSRCFPCRDCATAELPSRTRRVSRLPMGTLKLWLLPGWLCQLSRCRSVAELRGYPAPHFCRSLLSYIDVPSLLRCDCRSGKILRRFLRMGTG